METFHNVPGILSSGDGGSDFAGFLSLLCGWEVKPPKDGWRKCGIVTPAPGCFGVAWRILDAQYTRVPEFPRAVPQRRRRLILVGHLDSWLYPAKVLFDGEMCGGNTPPCRTKRQGFAAGIESGIDMAKSIRMRCGKPGGGKGALIGDNLSHTLATGNDQTIVAFPKDPCWWNGENHADTLTCTSNNQFMPDKSRLQCVIDMRQIESQEEEVSPTLIATDYKGGKAICEEVCPTLDANYPQKINQHDVTKLVCYENHATDSRIKEVPVSPTITSRAGTGGNNLPLVMDADEPVGFIKNDAGGEQQGYWTGAFPTVRSQVIPAVAYNVTFCDANGRRKDRPDGGLYVTEADASKTVTTGGTNAETVVINPLETPIALDGDKMAKAERKGGSGLGVNTDGVMYTQTVKDVHGVAYNECIPLDLRNATRDPDKHDAVNRQGVGIGNDGDPMNTVTASSVPGVGCQATVRRLLPVECERLMGFPDNYTRIPWKSKPEEECPDAPRYKACGNSMCVNVMAWIGYRIEETEKYYFNKEKYAGNN